LEFEVTEASISAATRIPITCEKWFKAMVLSSTFAKDLFKFEYQTKLSKSMPKSQLGKKEISWEHFVVTSHLKLDLEPTPQS
jgi:hypothetical protein